jgi:hypothetical protein
MVHMLGGYKAVSKETKLVGQEGQEPPTDM